MELKELLERLEKAKGPDRELDKALIQYDNRDDIGVCWCPGVCKIPGKVCVAIPLYTSSIDAAVALVEQVLPGWDYGMGSKGWGRVFNQERLVTECKRTIPLALCTALVKAKMAMENPEVVVDYA